MKRRRLQKDQDAIQDFHVDRVIGHVPGMVSEGPAKVYLKRTGIRFVSFGEAAPEQERIGFIAAARLYNVRFEEHRVDFGEADEEEAWIATEISEVRNCVWIEFREEAVAENGSGNVLCVQLIFFRKEDGLACTDQCKRLYKVPRGKEVPLENKYIELNCDRQPEPPMYAGRCKATESYYVDHVTDRMNHRRERRQIGPSTLDLSQEGIHIIPEEAGQHCGDTIPERGTGQYIPAGLLRRVWMIDQFEPSVDPAAIPLRYVVYLEYKENVSSEKMSGQTFLQVWLMRDKVDAQACVRFIRQTYNLL